MNSKLTWLFLFSLLLPTERTFTECLLLKFFLWGLRTAALFIQANSLFWFSKSFISLSFSCGGPPSTKVRGRVPFNTDCAGIPATTPLDSSRVHQLLESSHYLTRLVIFSRIWERHSLIQSSENAWLPLHMFVELGLLNTLSSRSYFLPTVSWITYRYKIALCLISYHVWNQWIHAAFLFVGIALQ